MTASEHPAVLLLSRLVDQLEVAEQELSETRKLQAFAAKRLGTVRRAIVAIARANEGSR